MEDGGVKALYRTYDAHWSRTGYSDEPGYPGQTAIVKDFPPRCPHCGGGMVGCGQPNWLRFRGIGPAAAHEAEGYVAWCKNGHAYSQEAISTIGGTAA
jgi:hypothetical protein